MPFFGFYREPIQCATEILGPTAEGRAAAATVSGKATQTTATGCKPSCLLRSTRSPPTPDGTVATAAAREAFLAAAREVAAAAAATEPASVARHAQASKVAAATAGRTPAAAAADAVGLEPVPTTELRGKYLALFFGASWCRHCRTFADRLHQVYSQLQHLQEQHQHQQQEKPHPHFETLYIPCDRSPAEFAAFACTMPWLSLPFGDYTTLIRGYGVRSLPSLVLIRPDGEVLISDAVPIIYDRDAAQKLSSILDWYQAQDPKDVFAAEKPRPTLFSSDVLKP
ncbi:hypothetical protein, conserved [Eimeria praecox]|uniref:protein-disulfide reductase n=1 Tax=Eimeria praecox TaxID=51316 RepID=U6GPU9_9EIME|nr:hypothetical protein, conserved [Eimeria praecox]